MSDSVLKDMLFIMMFGFAFMVFLMLPFLNPPAKDEDSKPPGNVIAFVEWPPGNVDVDTWLTGPNEPNPVGYSNMNGYLWNLLRDDTGTAADTSPSNFENAYTRGIVPGEYIINLHCYRCPDGPVPATLEVSVKPEGATNSKDTPIKVIAFTKVTLQDKEELTAIRFVLDANGDLVAGSLNHIFRQLRAEDTDYEEQGGWHP